MLLGGKVSAEARENAFPGTLRPWEHCGRDQHRFWENRNFENFSDRELFKNRTFVSEISSKSLISSAPALLAHVGLGKRKVGAETRRGAFPGRPRQWEHCGRDVHQF